MTVMTKRIRTLRCDEIRGLDGFVVPPGSQVRFICGLQSTTTEGCNLVPRLARHHFTLRTNFSFIVVTGRRSWGTHFTYRLDVSFVARCGACADGGLAIAAELVAAVLRNYDGSLF